MELFTIATKDLWKDLTKFVFDPSRIAFCYSEGLVCFVCQRHV